MGVGSRLGEIGVALPTAARPVGSYTTWTRTGNLLFLSGHICKRDGAVVAGKVGPGGEFDTAAAADLAELCALELLATIDAAVGLDNVARVVKVVGFVNATPEFNEHPRVINGASDLLVKVFGDDIGRHARSAVGASSLPLDAAVEVEAIVEVT